MLGKESLRDWENALALCSIYICLALKFPDYYSKYEQVIEYRNKFNEKIISFLETDNYKRKQRKKASRNLN